MEERKLLKERLLAIIEEDLQALQPNLAEAVKKQRYQQAARLRDKKKYLLNLKEQLVSFE
ncbi:MAG: hypothetical protein H6579_00185 [Chitinophagales bacterium]|nr:hypothetical protein [Chitinophagales bacterium]